MRKIILITGATDGIGLETAKQLGRMGYDLIIHGRNGDRIKKAIDIIAHAASDKIELFPIKADFSSFEEVREMVQEIKGNFSRLDVLINNAGVFMPREVITPDGFEATFQINHLSHFLLTVLLFDKIAVSDKGRIITVSSMAHSSSKIDFDNLRGEKNYDAYDAYARSKLANILFTFHLAERIMKKGVTANCLHPGVIATKLLHAGWGPFGADVETGAETSVFLATSENVKNVTGKYFVNKTPTMPASIAFDERHQRELWEFSAEATKADLNI